MPNSQKTLFAKLNYAFKLSLRFGFFKILIPFYYFFCTIRPIQEKKVLFIEHHYQNLSNSFQCLYSLLEKEYDFSLSVYHLLMNEGSKYSRVRRLLTGAKEIATARYVFLCESSHLVSSLPLRKGTCVTQLFHACSPFKKFGFSTAGLLSGDSKRNMRIFHSNRNYTYVTVANEMAIDPFAEAMCLEHEKEKIRPIGVSRTDTYFQPDFIQSAHDKYLHFFPNAAGKRVIFYGPTYRGVSSDANTPNALDFSLFSDAFFPDCVLLFKNHPITKYRPEIPPNCRHFVLDVSAGLLSIDDCIAVADVCITDYSSWIFEASLLEKPMVFYPHDFDAYCKWHGFYQDYFSFVPGPIAQTNEALVQIVKEVFAGFSKERIVTFKNLYMKTCDGHSTERIANMVFGTDILLYKKTPSLSSAEHFNT